MHFQTAKNFSSRMKTACVINDTIAPYQQALIETMRIGSYSIAIDGSNDSGVGKMNPLTVRIINADSCCCACHH